ncbi:hypothetical protein ACFL2G_05365 [Candidatus Omnitrophota bacterium]
MKSSKQIVRFGLLFLCIFVSVTIVCATTHAASIWEKRKQAVETVTKPAQEIEEAEIAKEESFDIEDEIMDLLDPDDIYIPDQYGTIIETYKGTNGKLILHVQDAHMNYEGQKNEAHILESLMEDYGLKLILLEGNVTDADFTYLRDYALLEDRVERADKLLKSGTINGVNYLNLATDYPITVQGIEDKKLYDINTEALWEMDTFKSLAQEYINKMITAADSLKPQIYSADLMEFDSKNKDYESEAIDLLAYYDYIYKKAEANDLPLYTFPNFTNLIKASDIEKKIDLTSIRDGSASAEDMDLYDEYIELTRDLNVNALFKEEPLLEDFLTDVLAVDSKQRKLLRISKALSIMKNLLIVKVVPEEYAYFLENKKDFNPKFWADFLNERSEELGLSPDVPSNSYIISDNLSKVERFYATAIDREKAFIRKTNERIEKDDVKLAALIAGGFHTPTLIELLRDQGYSYVVVSPKVTTPTDDKLYREALKREWAPGIE